MAKICEFYAVFWVSAYRPPWPNIRPIFAEYSAEYLVFGRTLNEMNA